MYNDHIQTSTHTIAGDAATRDTVKHTTKKYFGSIGQYRLTILPKSTGQNDTTNHKTRMERITKRLQELKTAEQTFDFREYTNRNQKQAFLIVHDSECMCVCVCVCGQIKVLTVALLSSYRHQERERPRKRGREREIER